MLRLSNIRIGTKLALMTGVAIALVVGLTALQQMAGNAVFQQNRVQDVALGVKVNVRLAQLSILRSWVERRNMLLAENHRGGGRGAQEYAQRRRHGSRSSSTTRH